MAFWRRKTDKRVIWQRQYDLTLNMTYHEKVALFFFTKNVIPVYCQLKLGSFIGDFVGVDRNFVLELDGWTHKDDEYDDNRSKYLFKHGFEVFRLTNEEVDEDHIVTIVNQADYVGIESMSRRISRINS